MGEHVALGAHGALRAAIGHSTMERIDASVASVVANVSAGVLDHIHHGVSQYPRGGNHFWELMRFDMLVDEHLDVWVVEINMSPNMWPHQEEDEHDDVKWRSRLQDSTLSEVAAWL